MRSRIKALLAQLRGEAAAVLVLAIGIAATAAVYLYVQRAVALQGRARFDALASSAVDAVRDRVDAHIAILRATRGLFAVHGEPTRQEFHEFVRSLEIDRFYPGIQGIGYAKVLRPDELARHEQSVRAEGFPGYRVWPAGPRESYTSVVEIEPFDWRNQRAFGFDMASEPTRRDAMLRARDTGTAACSGRVDLVQETGEERQAGFLIYLPVYAPESGQVAEPRRVRGFVYAPFRAGDLLWATLSGESLSNVSIDVYDGDHLGPGALLFESHPAALARAGPERLTHVDVAGRQWTIHLAAGAGFDPPWAEWLPRGVLLIGAFLTLLLLGVIRKEVRSRAEAQRAARRDRFLADAGELLSSSLDYRSTLAQVATLAAREQADRCVILLVEPEGLVRLAGHRVGAAPEDEELLAELLLDPEARLGADATLRGGEPFIAHAIDDVSLRRIAVTPEQLERLRAAGIRSIMTVPLRARGEFLGAVAFASCDPARRFDATDLAMGEDLGRLAVAAVDTARLYQRAQEAVGLRDDFLSIASHELKTPLTSLALQADSLVASAGRGRVPEAIGRKAEVIRRNVDRLSRLIANLLDISRIEAGRLDLFLEEVDLREILDDVATRFEDELARARCVLRVEADGPTVGQWDRLRLDQVVTNLLSNAVKYGPGRPITVTLRGESDRVELSVRDEGIGIPRDAHERIFERFERAVTDRHYGGFGLGLWIVRRIVEALGGEIHVESAPGEGATFTVVLRRHAAAESQRSPGQRDAKVAERDVC